MKKAVVSVAAMLSLLTVVGVAQGEIYTFRVKNLSTAVFGDCFNLTAKVAVGDGQDGNFLDFSSSRTIAPNGGEDTITTSNISDCHHINLSCNCTSGLRPLIGIMPCASGNYLIVGDSLAPMK